MAYSAVHGRICRISKPLKIHDCPCPCKNEKDSITNEGTGVATTLHLDFQTLKGSLSRSQLSDLAKIQTHPSFMHVLVTYKNEYDPIKNEGARVATTFLRL